jgi:hypothetical protein
MYLYIRVIALILFATCVASHQGTHTYRLSKFLKSFRCAVSLNSSAAKKRDYEPFLLTRQDFRRNISEPNFFSFSPKALWRRRGAHCTDLSPKVNYFHRFCFVERKTATNHTYIDASETTKAAYAAFVVQQNTYAEKEDPHPHVDCAFGLRITNCEPSNPSE